MGFLSMQMPGSSCPAGVTHFLFLCHILVRPVWQRLSSLPPCLLLLLSPTAEGWDVHLLSPWQDEAGFSGNCVKATKPPYILKKPQNNQTKKSSTIFFYSFFLSMMETGGQTGSSALPPPGAAPSPETRGTEPGRKAVQVCWVDKGEKNAAWSHFTFCCQLERCCQSRAASGQPLTGDGW